MITEYLSPAIASNSIAPSGVRVDLVRRPCIMMLTAPDALSLTRAERLA